MVQLKYRGLANHFWPGGLSVDPVLASLFLLNPGSNFFYINHSEKAVAVNVRFLRTEF